MNSSMPDGASASSYQNLDESELPPLSEISRAQELQIIGKNYQIWWNTTRFWKPHLDEGMENWNALNGLSFSEKELKWFKATNIDPVQIPIILPKVNALTGFQRANRRDGIVVAQGAPDAPDASLINLILKSIRQQTNLDHELSNTFLNGIVSGFPAFLSLDVEPGGYGEDDMCAFSEQWNSAIPDPNFTRIDNSDIQFYYQTRVGTQEQVINWYPEREEHIKKYAKINTVFDIYSSSDLIDSSERDLIIESAQDAQERYERNGLLTVIQRIHWIRKTVNVWLSPMSDEPIVLPPEWAPQQIQEWIQQNPEYEQGTMPMKILWVTTTTTSGMVLENGPHWFQGGRLPGQFFIPAMFNNQPKGWVSYLKDSQKMNSIGRTLYIHSLKYANDKLMIVKDNTLSDPEQASIEKARAGGVIFIKEDAEMSDIYFPEDQKGNSGYVELSAIAQDDLDVISAINPAMIGQQESANESKIAMDRRISQAQTAQGQYMDNYNLFHIELHKTILKMIPAIYDKYKIFRYTDEYDNVKEVSVNEPIERDPFSGEVIRVANNLHGAHYDYMLANGDNSVTGKEAENRIFMEITRELLPTIPEKFWSTFLINMPNRQAQEMGRQLAEERQAQQEAMASGQLADETQVKLNLNISGEDVQTGDPTIMEILQKQKVITGQTVTGQQKSRAEIDQQREQMEDPNGISQQQA